MIEFSCPKCRAVMSVPESLVGESEVCPSCGNSATVPNPVPVFAPPLQAPPPVFAQSAPVPMPRYAGVAFIGGLYQVLGIVCGLGGIAVIVISLFAESDRSRSSAISSVVGVGGVVSGLGLVLIGFVIIGIGQLFDCVRDMARNSFQLHRR